MARLRAGLVLIITMVLIAVYMFFAQANGVGMTERANSLAFFPLSLVGVVLMARHPRNPIGYLIGIIGLSVQGAGALYEFSVWAYHQGPAAFPFTDEVAWFSMNLWMPTYPCLVLILLLFPNGDFANRGWKVLGYTAVAITGAILLANVILGWPNRGLMIPTELGIPPESTPLWQLYQLLDVWNMIIVPLIAVALISVLIRFFRAHGVERQQLKWAVFGLAVVTMSIVISETVSLMDNRLLVSIANIFDLLSVVIFPATLLIAITRYRLYDIDVIIRRTLLYTLLTLTLGAIYVVAVLLMQAVLTKFIGVETMTVVVISTLLIAALFQPLRRRFQDAIDRRFYRSKFDAQQTLERFAARLRSEVDLDEIRHGLIEMVDENLQPEHVELWLVKRSA